MPYTPSNDWYYGMYGQNASNQLLGQGGNLANMISQYGGGNQYSTYNPSGLNYYTPIQNQNTSVYYKPTTQQSAGSQTGSNIVPLVNQPTNAPSTVPAYNNTNQRVPVSITLKSGRVIPIPPSPGGLFPSIGTMPSGAIINYSGDAQTNINQQTSFPFLTDRSGWVNRWQNEFIDKYGHNPSQEDYIAAGINQDDLSRVYKELSDATPPTDRFE